MARPKKNREVSIVHFSFFDLLFGAFGAFVFLMIMQVISTLNMVDVDIQNVVDEAVEEKIALKKELEKYQEIDHSLQNLQQQYDQIMADRKQLIQEKADLGQQNSQQQAELDTARQKIDSLSRFKEKVKHKGDLLQALEEENKKLEKSLNTARRKLAAIKTVPLKIKTTSIPTTITEENVQVALAAEGGSLPYTWQLEGNLPGGLSFNPVTGTIFGIAKSHGKYNLKARVTDAAGLNVAGNISFKVVKKYEEQKKKVSPMFVVMTLISSVLLMYILWGKFKFHKYKRKMEREGWQLDAKWIKKG